MSEKVGKCQYPRCKCNRKALPDSENHYCICHEQRDDKDIEAFNREIEKIMKLESYDFGGFYFPKDFNFNIIHKNLKNKAFNRKVYFTEAIFNCEANFEKIKFKNSTEFSYAKFKDIANFRNAEFKKTSNFEYATFEEWADFMYSKFKKKANFGYIKFKESGDFRHAKIEEAFFRATDFQEADFSYTTLKKADFVFARFHELTNFGHAKFQVVEFDYARFERETDFQKCSITKRISFSDANFYDTLSLVDIQGKNPRFNFRNTRFSNRTRIGGETNLDEVLFRGSTVEEVDFLGINFYENIYEEKLLKKKHKNEDLGDEEDFCPENWEEVSSIYRKLKQAHQRYGHYDIAGDFFYREMECKTKGISIKQFRQWLWFHFLSFTCGYGEKPWRVLRNSFACVLLYSFLYLFTNSIKFSGDSTTINLLRSIYFSTITFTTLGYGDITPANDVGRVLVMSEAFIGAIFIALFIFVFGRKMMR